MVDLAQLAYDASLRSLDKQEELVAEIRSRTGVLLAASSLAASFLGEPALADGSALLVCAPEAKKALLHALTATTADVGMVQPRRGTSLEEKYLEHLGRA